MKPRFFLFIPAYQCERQIPRVLGRVLESCYDLFDEILLVENRGADKTLEAALDFRSQHAMPKLTIVQNAENYGLGGSHKVAIRYALQKGYDYFVVLHGDNQADAAEIPRFIEKALADRACDAVLGDRFSFETRRPGYSLVRTLGNHGINAIFSLVLRNRVRDLGAGLNLYRLSSVQALPYERFSDHFEFNIHLLVSMIGARWNLAYLPIEWRSEDERSNVSAWRIGMKALKVLAKWGLHGEAMFTGNSSGKTFQEMANQLE